ncbi:unnamed protein product [Pleuronectes platessa]|uniref:Uncharacterized protein n=1 Tax=Pleuronectes platessa TaxID=8262 RepID=A0A9N7UW67_PLEPL|nr:unnamed protein product [Pleuronectes platessa]
MSYMSYTSYMSYMDALSAGGRPTNVSDQSEKTSAHDTEKCLSFRDRWTKDALNYAGCPRLTVEFCRCRTSNTTLTQPVFVNTQSDFISRGLKEAHGHYVLRSALDLPQILSPGHEREETINTVKKNLRIKVASLLPCTCLPFTHSLTVVRPDTNNGWKLRHLLLITTSGEEKASAALTEAALGLVVPGGFAGPVGKQLLVLSTRHTSQYQSVTGSPWFTTVKLRDFRDLQHLTDSHNKHPALTCEAPSLRSGVHLRTPLSPLLHPSRSGTSGTSGRSLTPGSLPPRCLPHSQPRAHGS